VREVVGGELGRDPAPAERQAGADYGHSRGRTAEYAQQVGQQARQADPEQHEHDRQALAGVARAARRCAQARADHPDYDRRHRDVLLSTRVLAEHSLSQEHEHEQPGRQRGLHHDQRRQQQRDHLQWPAEDRQARAQHPAPAPDQAPDQGQAQMLLVGRLLGVHRLQRDP
jgi:hypothetical protein